MSEAPSWPPLPEIGSADPQKEVKEALYKARLEDIKMERQARIEARKARVTARVERIKVERQAQIEAEKARVTANVEREKADWNNENTQAQAFNTAYIDVAKGQLDRSAARAEFIQKAAGAVGAAYTAVLAFSFALGTEGVNPLPARGIIPTTFLGLAIVLSAAYLAYLTRAGFTEETVSSETLASRQRERRNAFIRWAASPGYRRLYLLQASVFSLGFGVIFLPAPYLKVEALRLLTLANSQVVWALFIIAFVLTFFLPGLVNWFLIRLSRPAAQ